MEGDGVLPAELPRGGRGTLRVKRIVDVIVSGLALLILSPVMAGVALAVWVRMGRPVLFRQVRPGLHGREFELLKFRTMSDRTGPDGSPLPDEERLPPFGHWLRATSLDELPQLINVLRGEMSLVGPRPLLVEYLPLYSIDQAKRHNVRPGITGWAQTNGRNAISWDQKLELDAWYVDNLSLKLDLQIMILTLKKIIDRDGISAPGQATAEKFRGSQR